MVGRGEKRLLWDPGFDMRLGRREKRRAKIINGMGKQKCIFERFCLWIVFVPFAVPSSIQTSPGTLAKAERDNIQVIRRDPGS